MIDPGEGAARRLSNMGFPTGSIEAVILTHLHSDHIDGLGGILLQSWVGGGRKHPTTVYGPDGVEKVVAGVNEMFLVDSTFRTAHHGNAVADPAGYGAKSQVVALGETEPTKIIDTETLKITATSVSHAPVYPARGYGSTIQADLSASAVTRFRTRNS
ncbi:Metallo-beta-lactamase superfamily protein [Shimia gijangensis]|uniref:Metallo-beta-lactamase superfamily protein n=1 Tax=Shimia gijangensis TaxID=1470563 RepID=A0A1M6KYR7_9RHOB|nr:Metallo-beta-lactamase superfamily protein [Shimia gijangensis]